MKHKIPINTVRVIANVDGKISAQDYDLNKMINDPYPEISIGVPEEMMAKPTNVIDESKIIPFIPYAMTTEHGERFMERTELGIAEVNGKRIVTEQSYVDDIVRPLTVPAIVGDDVGPVGMFIPFTASREAIGACAELFVDIYENHSNPNSFVEGIVDYAHNPKYKKLPF